MKRSSLHRRTPLRRTGMSSRRMALRRRSVARAGSLTSSRPRVTPEERQARTLTRKRSGARCEVLLEGWCLGGRLNFHHRMDTSVGGLWTAPNGLMACGSGTTGCHGWITEHPAGARPKGWSVRSHVDPRRTPVLRRGRWVLLLDNGLLITLQEHEVVTSVDGTEPVYVGEIPEVPS